MKQLKTIAAPRALKVHRKEKVWTIAPAPGPHPSAWAIPLGTLLRDYLALAENRKEIKFILNNSTVFVDGRRIKDDRFPIGLLDVVSIDKIEKTYIIMVDHKGRLYPKELEKGKAKDSKLCKLTGKTVIKGGQVQLNFYDGKNVVVEAKDAKKYKVGGTALIKVPEIKITEFIEPGVGKTALVAKGRHSGKIGKIVDVTKGGLNLRSLTTIESGGEKVVTNTDYVFIIGDKAPRI